MTTEQKAAQDMADLLSEAKRSYFLALDCAEDGIDDFGAAQRVRDAVATAKNLVQACGTTQRAIVTYTLILDMAADMSATFAVAS